MVSTPRPVSHSGIEVAITRMSLVPDSTSWRTRCAPRNPVPPVIRVVGGTFLTIAACFFVLFWGTICAVRFFEGGFGILSYGVSTGSGSDRVRPGDLELCAELRPGRYRSR